MKRPQDTQFDVLVAGSGASAVHAAWPLVHAGLRVALIDPANRDTHYEPLVPPKDFLTIRRNDPEQHRYFLGDWFEGIPFGPVQVGAQLTPPRQYIMKDTERWARVQSAAFHPMQSLALGGLAAGWGAFTMPFTDTDLADWPISRRDLQPHYDTISRRIGISGPERDDLSRFTGPIDGLLPPARIDSNARHVYRTYRKRRKSLNRRGLYAGLPRLAVATEQHAGRGPLRYRDMEFWTDHDRAVYRPQFTVEELQSRENFALLDRRLAVTFEEIDEGGGKRVAVQCMNIRDSTVETFTARRLILAAGTLGTARIVLRSLKLFETRVPLVCNPYTYFPCVVAPRIGKKSRNSRHSLTQLTMVFDPGGTGHRLLQPQLYSYRSLMLFKLVKESPLAHRESIRLMRLLQEFFAIIGVHHEDRPEPGKNLALRHGTTPRSQPLAIRFDPSGVTERQRRRDERRLCACLRTLGCWPVKAIRPGHGSSIHYAGTFPMASTGGPLTCHPDGRLRAATSVYLADGSTFPHLPAKGLTFTLMANANRIGDQIARELRAESS